MSDLVIASTPLTTDSEGRYNLNALHRASGAPASKRPPIWMENKATKELIAATSDQYHHGDTGQEVISVVNGTATPGTYAVKELALAYANWVAPRFYLQVIGVFIESKAPHVPKALSPPEQLDALERIRLIAIQEEDDVLTSMVLDTIKNSVLPAIAGHPPALAAPTMFQVHELLEELGMSPAGIRREAQRCGRAVAQGYREDFNQEPPTAPRVIDGARRFVKAYPQSWRATAMDLIGNTLGV